MTSKLIYQKNTSIDGHPITKNGKPLSKQEIISELNLLVNTISMLKDTLWTESTRLASMRDTMDARINDATNIIGKYERF